MKFPDIKYLFEPKSIAVVGASHNESKIGYKILNNIKSSGFEGRIYPVNPQGGIILGIDVKKGISEIPENIDIAVISIPAKFVFDAVKDACSKKVKFLIIITSGFSEIGNIEEEKKIVDYARNHGARVLGPNIFGIYSGASPINATFGSEDISKGNVAIVTQSGALGIAMMGKTRSAHIGLSAMISVGNKSDVDESDLLDYLVQDKNTKVIMMYIEGIKHGEKLVAALKNATKKKPVIAIKSGRSKRGAMAAASHTGSLAGADSIFSDIMMQCGVMRAESIEEAFGWCNFLSTAPHPKGENTVIITNGGGIGVMAADACEKYGVRLYDDLNKLNTLFSGAIPSFGSSKNPIDITGGADKNQYMQALKVAFKDKAVDSIICIGCETAIFKGSSLFEMISQIEENKMCRKPIIYSFIGGPEFDAAISSLKMKKIPMYGDVYEAISAIGVL
ncbi:MAG: CoA-binding protein, partial [Nanoarchaeota archaeon]|nr:CoA-binding protein [Nanoarchaeota archaeon]